MSALIASAVAPGYGLDNALPTGRHSFTIVLPSLPAPSLVTNAYSSPY